MGTNTHPYFVQLFYTVASRRAPEMPVLCTIYPRDWTPDMSNEQTNLDPNPDHDPGSEDSDDRLTAADAVGFVGEVAREAAGTLIWNVLFYGGLIVAFVLPIVGIVLGIICIVIALRIGRSKVIPILMIIFSVVVWILTSSPLGLLGILLA